MNLKKVILALTGVAMSCALLAGNAFAATSWSACTPQQIGPYGDFVRIRVINCNINPAAATNGWMTLSATGTDQMMAAILTAMSLGKGVAIGYDGSTDPEGYKYATAVIFKN